MTIHYDHFKTISPLGDETSEQLLGMIGDAVRACRKCYLCEGRTNAVPGFGNAGARIMLIGEAPGKNEDLQGKPFVGAAGNYLTELLGYAGLTREEVFIANILKCRPPSNRNPQPDEIFECTPYLRDQVRAIMPEYIVTMGNFATKFILRTDRGITGLRGNLQKTGQFSVLPVFHPAAAIYDRTKREVLEADFVYLGRLLGNVPWEGDAPNDGR
ncbi:uracil-DNA glycosylase [Slackia heliotrinireducens]|jgi:DNA polymerase|uniref:Type-4 uracil-DNA glycosylase n=1 Tax=Slackia heliotrinireducens (strain ATCC 29202 / DSM 20476 / NCTC 11029 / RHS 1) TaxID=471855 RepID=C7N4J2_SLAHD|nr:uracil-DNA glycosylase [Slackia heliotrinireducens]ACV21827.1 uracil-DNA glycosylase, family 4 [Slackia heliotrinireducens DSM 20476]VEG99550.1 uracil-DNA glycosylase, family 4 [Slackia heliotrinireducens]